MTPFRIFAIAVATTVLGFVGGYLFYAHTVARYDAISSVCVAMQEAVEHELLTPAEVKTLGSWTGSVLKQQYRSVADKLSLPQQGVRDASPDSMCSQFLVGVHASP